MKIAIILVIAIFGTFAALSHGAKKVYAATSDWSIPNTTDKFTWIAGPAIQLEVIEQPNSSNPTDLYACFSSATVFTSIGSSGTPGYDFGPCNLPGDTAHSGYQNILNLIEGLQGLNSNTTDSDIFIAGVSPQTLEGLSNDIYFDDGFAGGRSSTQNIQGPFPISVYGGTVTAGEGAINWYDSKGNLVSTAAEASSEGKNLEFLSPTEIYDTVTKATYTTIANASPAEGQFSSGGGTHYFNDGWTFYWPSSPLNATNAIPGTDNCYGGIAALSSSSGGDDYLGMWLIPAIYTSGGYCAFGYNGEVQLVNSANSDFQNPPPAVPNTTNDWSLGYGLGNMNLGYAMFEWTDPNTLVNINDPSAPSLINLKTSSNTTYNTAYTFLLSAANKTSGLIFTTDACMSEKTSYPPFLYVPYSDSSDPSATNITTNTEGYFYVTNGASSESSWVTSNSGNNFGLNCLINDIPKRNTINGNSGAGTGNDNTFIANPMQSVCPTGGTDCTTTPIVPGNPTTGSGVDTCYDDETGHTYLCGENAAPLSNRYSIDPVVYLSCTPSSTCTSTNSYYELDKQSTSGYEFLGPSECYDAQLLPYDSQHQKVSDVYAWVEQPQTDCTESNYLLSTAENNSPLLALPPLGGGGTDIADTESVGHQCAVPDQGNKTTNCLVNTYVDGFIRFLSVAVGLVAIIAVVTGGIQYSTSRDNPEAVKAARKRIFNALLGVVVYFLLYAFLNFIVPGGV